MLTEVEKFVQTQLGRVYVVVVVVEEVGGATTTFWDALVFTGVVVDVVEEMVDVIVVVVAGTVVEVVLMLAAAVRTGWRGGPLDDDDGMAPATPAAIRPMQSMVAPAIPPTRIFGQCGVRPDARRASSSAQVSRS